jgi:protein-disulfide isomerase
VHAVAVERGGRRGRWLVLGLLTVGLVALIAGLADLATQKPNRSQVHISGIEESLQIFGGVEADGNRIGPSDAPVSIQWFDDLQCSSCREQFLATIPALVSDYARPGDVQLAYRHYSFSSATEELGFFGAEAAADQGYAWPYIYLFFHNQDEAKRLGVDDDFLTAVAGAIPELDVPEWRDYLDAERSSDGQIGKRLARYEDLGAGLGIRAQPAAIVSGPKGTQTLQDSPTLAEIKAAIAAVD